MININGLGNSLYMQRTLKSASDGVPLALERLSSGLRINSAKDDAAGMQISSRLTSQVNGFAVAIRNANDGISMAQTAEGSLGVITDNLQRLRDLSLQASNGSLSETDKEALQAEANQLKAEITRVSETTAFGGQKLFQTGNNLFSDADKSKRTIIQTLQAGVLAESEDIIIDRLGLVGNGASLKIDLEHIDGVNGRLASISYVGAGLNQVFTVDIDDFSNPSQATIENLKGTALHEMVHAVMANNIANLSSTPSWFVEGTAEAIRGADDRLAGDITSFGAAAIKAQLNSEFGNNSAPLTTGIEVAGVYSGGYVTMRYLEDKIGEGGIKTLMSELAGNATFDNALNTASNGAYANNGALQTELMAGTTFEDFITAKMDLTNQDNGAFGGADAAGGVSRAFTITGSSTSSSPSGFYVTVVSGDNDNNGTDFAPNVNYGAAGFKEVALEDYSPLSNRNGGEVYSFQVGSEANQTIEMRFANFSAHALALDSIDLTTNAQSAVFSIDSAIKFVDSERAGLGAVMNRMEYAINNMSNMSQNLSDSRSRIQDVDFAVETANLTKTQIRTQAASAMLAQANQNTQLVLSLLG
jgi:flagellin